MACNDEGASVGLSPVQKVCGKCICRFTVEAGRGFVGQYDLRGVGECTGDGDPLPFAAGEGGHASGWVGDVELREQVLSGGSQRYAFGLRPEHGLQPGIVRWVQFVEEQVILEDETHLLRAKLCSLGSVQNQEFGFAQVHLTRPIRS